jgi:predicted ribosome quality control (RQC) complex YloA/Tae2 family protein
MDSIDKLLAALEAVDNPTVNRDRSQHLPTVPTKSNDIEELLNRVKRDFEQKELIEVQTEKVKLQQQQQQKKANLEKTARQWLKNLDPLSGAGLWFTDFARNFSSPLEAAIAYLEPQDH